jgi:hypothetical protein
VYVVNAMKGGRKYRICFLERRYMESWEMQNIEMWKRMDKHFHGFYVISAEFRETLHLGLPQRVEPEVGFLSESLRQPYRPI